jgi:thiamine-monophosphate kinase
MAPTIQPPLSSEHQRIRKLSELFARPSREVRIGIGDDCAVLAPTTRDEVWTVDVAVEGVHFRRDFMALDAIGYRAFMAAASDIAAMGARARAALNSLTLPKNFSDAELQALCTGIARAADACACPVVGGNLSRGRELTITTTVLGEAYGMPIARGTARPGDALFVTGPIGASALGLALLQRGSVDATTQAFANAFVAPRARLDLAERIALHATSALDISDGLFDDAGRIAEGSGLTLRLELALVPRLPEFDVSARALGLDPNALVLGGGEDYELLFTADANAIQGTWATRIGSVVPGASRVEAVDENGSVLHEVARGFDHFRR